MTCLVRRFERDDYGKWEPVAWGNATDDKVQAPGDRDDCRDWANWSMSLSPGDTTCLRCFWFYKQWCDEQLKRQLEANDRARWAPFAIPVKK